MFWNESVIARQIFQTNQPKGYENSLCFDEHFS